MCWACTRCLGATFLPEEDRVPERAGGDGDRLRFLEAPVRRQPERASAQALALNNRRYTIVGVAPKDFHGANALVEHGPVGPHDDVSAIVPHGGLGELSQSPVIPGHRQA